MEQQKKTDRTEELMEIARLRFGMIAPVIQRRIQMNPLWLTAGGYRKPPCGFRTGGR